MKKTIYPLGIILVITFAFGYFGNQISNFADLLLIVAVGWIISNTYVPIQKIPGQA
jgi:hypothetical protein